MQLTLPLAQTRRLLLALWFTFVIAGAASEFLPFILRLEETPDWVGILSLSYEDNIPTWYSSFVLSACGVVLACIALRPPAERQGHGFHWTLLCAGFFYISLDESASYHEHLSLFFKGTRGVLYFGWVIPAGILVALLGVVFLKFLAVLPKAVRWRFVTAGFIYVTGALLMELPLGWWVDHAGREARLGYVLIDWVQESMELLGSTLFLISLLRYFDERPGQSSTPS